MVFNFKEINKSTHKWRKAEAIAKNGENPYEHPTVRMQLGGGDVHLGQERALEESEG